MRKHRVAAEDRSPVEPGFAQGGEAAEIEIEFFVRDNRFTIEAAAKPIFGCIGAGGSGHGCGSEAQVTQSLRRVRGFRDRDFPIRQKRNGRLSGPGLAGSDHRECWWTPSAMR